MLKNESLLKSKTLIDRTTYALLDYPYQFYVNSIINISFVNNFRILLLMSNKLKNLCKTLILLGNCDKHANRLNLNVLLIYIYVIFIPEDEYTAYKHL